MSTDLQRDMSQGTDDDGLDIGLPIRGYTQRIVQHSMVTPGDCLRASVASIFGLKPRTVPHFATYGLGLEPPDKNGWWLSLVGFADTLEPSYQTFVGDATKAPPPSNSRNDLYGCYLATGWSTRGEWMHTVVARGGQVIWDPHPSRAGLKGDPVEVVWFVRRAISQSAVHVADDDTSERDIRPNSAHSPSPRKDSE